VTLASGFLATGVGYGQSSVLEGERPGTEEPEKIEVTGSRIKRTQVEGVSPIQVIDREELNRSGVSTVSEVLQNMAISSQGSYSSPIVNDSRGTVTRVNLRGLGPENTLVLLNGRRLPGEGGEGVVDLSTIPMAAIERVEILKDSASAIYGSDATGGVVNIITKKSFNGSALYGRASAPDGLEGNQQTDFSYTTGVNRDDFRLLTSVAYRHVEPTFHRDRDWTERGLSFYAYPGNYSFLTEDAEIQKHPNCNVPEDEQITATAGGEKLCSYNYGETMAFSPETTQLSFLNNLEYDLNEDLSVFSNIRAVKNTNIWNMAPNAGFFTIPQDVAQANLNKLGLAQAPSDVQVYYRAVPWGLRQWEEEKTLFGGDIGLRGYVGGTWEWTASASHSESKKDSINPQGFMLVDELVSAISTGEFNPFQTNLSESSLAVVNSASYQPFVITETQMQMYNFDMNGELFELPGGMAGIAVGASRIEEEYSKLIDQQSENGNVFGVVEDKSDAGSRGISAAYVELGLPVLDSLDLQLAVRHDVYSDFGSTTNPKFGFKYMPMDRFMVRGNVATGFKAPTLKEIHRSTTIGLENLVDRPVCGLDCTDLTTEVEIEVSGNEGLEEETSLAYNLGFVTEPIDRLSVTADYWYIKIEDIVSELEAQRVLDQIAQGRSFEGIEVTRLGGTLAGRLQRIKIPVLNLAESEDAGIDTRVAYNFRVGGNRFDVESQYSRKFYARSIPFPGVGQEDTLGERGEPRWRAVSSAIWSLGGHSVLLRNNLIGEQQSANDPDQTISQYSTYDTQYAWNHPWNGQLAVGALNVFDTDFPRDPTERAGDDVRVETLYSPHGRVFYASLNQVF
jgi:iron complex outermembrane receptor protein